jgi:hypothetical protein
LTYHILNLGAGVQSTTLYLMSLRQDEPEHVPPFDYAIFADTQDEPDEVYRHLDWMESLGGPPILRRSFGKLGDDIIRGHHQVRRKEGAKHRAGQLVDQCYQIPAFVKGATGRRGIVPRKCTRAYKIEVVERAIREEVVGLARGQRFPGGVSVRQYFGLSYDEPSRIVRTQALARGRGWFDPRFPLFDLEMTRADCRAYLAERVPHRTPRSACVFCPYHSDAEWRRIRDHDPAAWERACAVDEAMRTPAAACAQQLDGTLYLHESCKPLRTAPIDTPESRGEQYQFGFAQECEGMCGN